jgi:hypothetical protein
LEWAKQKKIYGENIWWYGNGQTMKLIWAVSRALRMDGGRNKKGETNKW